MKVLIILALFLSACSREIMQVRSEYLDAGYLASTFVDTPDPLPLCFYGQQIVIRYAIPAECFCQNEIVLTARFGNGCEEVYRFPVEKRWGYLTYRLTNDEYDERGGIITYKVELFREGELIAVKEHHLWVEVIEVGN